jgi:hypothetical protein
MPRSVIATRVVIALLVSAFAAAVGAELLLGRSSTFEMIALLVVLVGLRVAARQLRKPTP